MNVVTRGPSVTASTRGRGGRPTPRQVGDASGAARRCRPNVRRCIAPALAGHLLPFQKEHIIAALPVDLSADSCAALFERIRLGDAKAEDELVESFGGKVYAMAVARTRDREASRDLVQDVLWAVIQALRGGHLRAPDKLAAFVSGTARNLINNYCRTRRREPPDTAVPSAPSTTDAEHAFDDRHRAGVVRAAVRGLESTDRRILALTLVDGLTAVEIATRLHLNPDAVRQRKSRAVKKIMALIAERTGR